MKNKLVAIVDGEEHVLYEVSAEIVSTLRRSDIFHTTFKGVSRYDDRVIQSLSNTRSEAERARTAIDLLADLWAHRIEFGPWVLPNLLVKYEYARRFHERYRDHTVHPLRVLLLGLYLYARNSAIRAMLTPLLASLGAANQPQEEYLFIDLWTLTSLYHDQGYVFELPIDSPSGTLPPDLMQHLNESFQSPLSDYLREHFDVNLPVERERRARLGLRLPQTFYVSTFNDLLYEPAGDTTILDAIEPLIKDCHVAAHDHGLLNYFDMARRERPSAVSRPPYHDHGIASAVMLLRCHTELARYVADLSNADTQRRLTIFIPDNSISELVRLLDDTLQKSTPLVQQAATAIALHNVDPSIWDSSQYTRPPYNLSLESFRVCGKTHPLAFFLYLCDTLQDWDRPRFTVPGAADDRIRLDQHMLISSDEERVAIALYEPELESAPMSQPAYDALVRQLEKRLCKDELLALLVNDPNFTFPEDLSAEPENQLAARERLRIQQRYEGLDSQWGAYVRWRATQSAHALAGQEEEARSRRLRQFGMFLQWCEEEKYEYLRPSNDSRIQRLYDLIGAEIHELNYAVLGLKVEGRTIVSKIGAGGYGSVFRVQRDDVGNGSTEALKVFHTDNFKIPELVDRFRRGHNSMKLLSHRQITRVSEFILVPRGYLMEYIDGQNLAIFLGNRESRRAMPSADQRIELMLEICSIVQYAHQEGVIHRDIKPANIIMRWSADSEKYEPVLTDFDLAWFTQAVALTMSGMEVIGSYLYAAPEQRAVHEDSKLIQKPTIDVFGLGRLMYFVFTESDPEEGFDLGNHLQDVVRRKFSDVDLRSFSYRLSEIYQKSTHGAPDLRYQKVTDMMADLSELREFCPRMDSAIRLRMFLVELALRMANDQDYESAKRNADERVVRIVWPEGEFRIESNGRGPVPYFQVDLVISSAGLVARQKRSFRAARDRTNLDLDDIIARSPFVVRRVTKGRSGESFYYGFRLEVPRLSFTNLLAVENFLQELRSVAER